MGRHAKSKSSSSTVRKTTSFTRSRSSSTRVPDGDDSSPAQHQHEDVALQPLVVADPSASSSASASHRHGYSHPHSQSHAYSLSTASASTSASISSSRRSTVSLALSPLPPDPSLQQEEGEAGPPHPVTAATTAAVTLPAAPVASAHSFPHSLHASLDETRLQGRPHVHAALQGPESSARPGPDPLTVTSSPFPQHHARSTSLSSTSSFDPTLENIDASSDTDRPPLLEADLDMASKTTPFLASKPEVPPYGSVSLTPSRNNSPAGSDSRNMNAHQLHRVPDTVRSDTSRRSMFSKQSSRLSEDADGAVLVSGLDGRFGVAEANGATGVFEDTGKDDVSEDGPLLDDASTNAPDDDEFEENSPHEAVRASVPPTDNTTLSINTPRMWCLSVLFSILGSSTNLFFSLRYPSVAITPVIALLLVHPLGHLWDFLLKRSYDPAETFVDGVRMPSTPDGNVSRPRKKLRSWRQWLAQGRWNEKEHTCVYVSSNVAFGFAFATDVIVEQTKFYNQEAPIVYQLLLTISTQILGYGFAGITRCFLVRPSGMIWPGTLMSAAMFSTLHKQENKPADGWTISRWKFFYIIWSFAFVFYFLPGLLMPALSYFNVITWFAPKNVVIANLFGVSSGLGLFPLTFDWAQVTYVGSPLLVPFWAAMNVIGGLAVVMWIIAPILYYSNFLFSSYMPILSAAVFDNTGKVYDVSKILTSDFLFDRDAYQNYSRVFLPITYVLSYGVQFAGLAALLTHTACWHGKDIWRTWLKALSEAREDSTPNKYERVADATELPASRDSMDGHGGLSGSTSNLDGLLSREDIHSRLMKRYKDAPLSWYLLTFVSMAAIGIFVVE